MEPQPEKAQFQSWEIFVMFGFVDIIAQDMFLMSVKKREKLMVFWFIMWENVVGSDCCETVFLHECCNSVFQKIPKQYDRFSVPIIENLFSNFNF